MKGTGLTRREPYNLYMNKKYIDYLFSEVIKSNPKEDELYNEAEWLYLPKYFTNFRYLLGIKGDKPLLCIGINPSTAVPNNLDNTCKSAQNIALANNYNSFIMYNVYPQRATDPNDLDRELDINIHQESLKALTYAINELKVKDIWLAYGNLITKRKYLAKCLLDILNIILSYPDINLYYAGLILKSGHPHHPLYLKKDTKLNKYNPEELKKLISLLKEK